MSRRKTASKLYTTSLIASVGVIPAEAGIQEKTGFRVKSGMTNLHETYDVTYRMPEAVTAVIERPNYTFEVKTNKDNTCLSKTLIVASGAKRRHLNPFGSIPRGLPRLSSLRPRFSSG